MTFFTREYFNLPSNASQEGISTVVENNGTIYQDGTWGYIRTYADADVAMFVSETSLTPAEFGNQTIKFSIQYQLTSLNASDALYFSFCDNATAPAADNTGTIMVAMFLLNTAGTY
jgi:hypothetical protein